MISPDDDVLEDLLARCLAEIEAGREPDVAALCSSRPDLGPRLSQLLSKSRRVVALVRSDDPMLGTLLGGRYRVEKRIGSGGMGHVYAARDERLGRQVAVKVMDAVAWSHAPSRERFVREAASLAALQDRHVVAVHDCDLTGNPPYLVMDLVAGVDLATFLRELWSAAPGGDLPAPPVVAAAAARLLGGAAAPVLFEKRWPEVVARLALDMCAALVAAHAQGVVHRDVKPGNFMLDDQGRLRLLDFGLARRAQDATLTRSQAKLGTPLYMSPEQVRGEAVGPATDVYSLGATLYQMLCLEPPFSGAPERLEAAIQFDEPVPPQARRPGCPADLAAICLVALRKDPRRRYASIAELEADVERFLAYEPVLARARVWPAHLRQCVSFGRRYRRPLVVGSSLAVVLLLGGVAWSEWSARRRVDAGLRDREMVQGWLAALEPGLGLAGSRDERLRSPSRPAQMQLLDSILERAPDNVEARFLRATLLDEAGDGARAETDRARLRSLLPAETLKALETAFVAHRDRPATVKAVQEAMKGVVATLRALPDGGPHADLRRRLLLMALIDAGQANEAYELALTAPLPTAATCFAVGQGLVQRNRYDREALVQLEQSHRLCPTYLPTLLGLARVAYQIGDLETAEKWMETCMAQSPRHAHYHHQRFLILRDQRKLAAAEAALAAFPAAAEPLRQFDLATLRVHASYQAADPSERERLLREAITILEGVLAGKDAEAAVRRSAGNQLKRVQSLVSGTPEARRNILLDAENPLDPYLLWSLAKELLRAPERPEQVKFARLLLGQVLRMRPTDDYSARLLAESWADEDPRKAIDVLRNHLVPAALLPEDGRLIARLIGKLDSRARQEAHQELAKAGLIPK